MNTRDVVRQRQTMKRKIVLFGVETGVVIALLSLSSLLCKQRGHTVASTFLMSAFFTYLLFSFLRLIRIERINCIKCPICGSSISSDFQFAMLLATKKCYHCAAVIVTETETSFAQNKETRKPGC